MSKQKKQTKKSGGVKVTKPTRKKKRVTVQRSPMGPVSAISTAPVAIGNSVRGASCISKTTGKGVIVMGRDFMFTPIGPGSVTTWTVLGGTPLTPAAFADSTLRQYMQLYQKFRWKAVAVHYITSSPTSSNGDILIYRGKNRNSVFLNQTSSMLLPVVISDPDTVMGPQWTNHSTRMTLTGDWKSTDYGMSSDINEYAEGELFLLGKMASADSPGYMIFDYIVEFADLQVSPRLLTLPLPRALYHQMNVTFPAGSVTASTIAYTTGLGTNISGSTSTIPSGCVAGDVYKVILDITNSNISGWTNVGPTNLFKIQTVGGVSAADTSINLIDGTTIYAVYGADTKWYYFATPEGAYSGADSLAFGVTGASVSFNLQIWVSLVGSVSSVNLNPNY